MQQTNGERFYQLSGATWEKARTAHAPGHLTYVRVRHQDSAGTYPPCQRRSRVIGRNGRAIAAPCCGTRDRYQCFSGGCRGDRARAGTAIGMMLAIRVFVITEKWLSTTLTLVANSKIVLTNWLEMNRFRAWQSNSPPISH